MQNYMVVFTFSVFNQKYSFWANLFKKIKIISLSWNWVIRIVRICRSLRWFSLFLFLTRSNLFLANLTQKLKKCFSLGIPFLGKFGPKNQGCRLKMKFQASTISTMKNSVLMFIFFVFGWKYLFWGNSVPKNQNCWSWNLEPRLIRIWW